MRWFLIDRFYDITPFQSLKAAKLISHNEAYFAKHFPWKPIFPPTLQLEMMAQAGGVLAGICHGFRKDVILGKVEVCEFLRDLVPPRRVEIEAKLLAHDETSAWAEMKLMDEDGLAAGSKIMFVYLDSLNPKDGESFVFSTEFMRMFGLAEFKSSKAAGGAV